MPTFRAVSHNDDEATSSAGQQYPHSPDNRTPPSIPNTPSITSTPLPRTVNRGRIALHPDLRSENISFDVSLPPASVTGSLPQSQWLQEPATRPALQSLTILSNFLPWPIVVHASAIRPSVVTIADVLWTVHGSLMTPISEYEYRALHSSSSSLGHRYDPRVTRLALLRGHHWWVGLTPSVEGPEIFFLQLER